MNKKTMTLIEIQNLFSTTLLLLIFIKISRSNNNPNKDDYLIASNILEQTINNYKTLVLQEQINILESQHDVDPKSQVNSIDLYNKKYNDLLQMSAKSIIRSLSSHTFKILLKNYSESGLIYHITFILKQ